MEFRHLEAFLAIADELHFGRAAARLRVAQSSLSEQLSKLERAVGVRLVERTSHRVALSEAGEAFRGEAMRLLAARARAVEVARAAAAGDAGHLRIGFNYPAGQRVLMPAMARLHERWPRIRTTLREGRTGPQLSDLTSGRLDLAFVYGRPTVPGVCHEHVLTVPVVALVGERHPLAGREEIRCAELAAHRCVIFRREQSPAMYDAIVAAGVELSPLDRVDDPAATEIVVATEMLVAFASAVRAETGVGGNLTAVQLTDPVPTLDVYAVWRENSDRAVRLFLDCVRDR
nr:LysR family transcriptional regulator [Fodinicola acaciae]